MCTCVPMHTLIFMHDVARVGHCMSSFISLHLIFLRDPLTKSEVHYFVYSWFCSTLLSFQAWGPMPVFCMGTGDLLSCPLSYTINSFIEWTISPATTLGWLASHEYFVHGPFLPSTLGINRCVWFPRLFSAYVLPASPFKFCNSLSHILLTTGLCFRCPCTFHSVASGLS